MIKDAIKSVAEGFGGVVQNIGLSGDAELKRQQRIIYNKFEKDFEQIKKDRKKLKKKNRWEDSDEKEYEDAYNLYMKAKDALV